MTTDPPTALAKYQRDPSRWNLIVRPIDLMPLNEFVRLDVVEVDLGQCADVGGGKMMPARDTTDRIASAAGIVFVACRVEKIDKMVWVGHARAKRMQRDGTWAEAEASYEWDAELRAEELATRGRDKTDLDRARDLLQMRKFGHQRADTGARMRVIRVLAGIPTAFSKADVRKPLVVHRAQLDAPAMMADPVVRDALVNRMFGATADLFGPSGLKDVTPVPEQIEAPADEHAEEAIEDAKRELRELVEDGPHTPRDDVAAQAMAIHAAPDATPADVSQMIERLTAYYAAIAAAENAAAEKAQDTSELDAAANAGFIGAESQA